MGHITKVRGAGSPVGFIIAILDENTTIFLQIEILIIDDLYRHFAPQEVINRHHVSDAKLSDSEIITISICGELAGIDSENAWFSFVKNYRHLFPNLCSRSRFNRTRRALLQTTDKQFFP